MDGFKKTWHEFQNGRPGKRFQDRYERNERQRSERSVFQRLLKPVAGVGLVLAGIVFCLIPGPGLPLTLIGAGLLADVSPTVARGMDWLDVRIRNALSGIRRIWDGASTVAKTAGTALLMFLACGAGYGLFDMLTSK